MAANLFEDIFAQGRLLIVVIFLLTIVVLGVIWGNRQMQRKSLLSKKGPLSPAGFNAPKELKKEIEESFNRISEMRLEPKLLSGDGDNEPTYSTFVDRKDDTSYKYRRKAFDLMSCLDELLCRVSICLARKHSQTVREHLNVLQFPPYAPFEDLGDLCEKVTSFYEQARYGAKEFGEDEFVLYSNGIDQIYDRVHQKFLVPGSLLVNSEHHQKMKDSECHENFDQDSLIEPSVSTESDNLFGIRNREGLKLLLHRTN